LLLSRGLPAGSQTPVFDVTVKTIPELAAAMRSGATTSKRLVQAYLDRIEAFDHRGPAINAIISINPKALDEADALDRVRAARGPRGPVQGIPIVLKDNYDTAENADHGGVDRAERIDAGARCLSGAEAARRRSGHRRQVEPARVRARDHDHQAPPLRISVSAASCAPPSSGWPSGARRPWRSQLRRCRRKVMSR
jgi:Amidase